ncbi:hypothetical protein AS026_30195 [Rhizobium altiplani]|uniref:Uncharacterized protein n=1 Tax=Rhizobium altiplani TaxID=1864509 RepID=A0A109K0B7_9HYPH|nr:hypothetical protein AS026_30195 [Rhizobium altiplani]
MTLGEVGQAPSAFAIVQSAFGWLVDNYPRLPDWNACRRIASLMMSLDELERAEQSDALGRIKRGETEGEVVLSLDDLAVSLDDGTEVVLGKEKAQERFASIGEAQSGGCGGSIRAPPQRPVHKAKSRSMTPGQGS